jgi:hypothetical protein
MAGMPVGEMMSQEMHEAVHQSLDEVSRRLESGELDGSGRYYSDKELAAGSATRSANPKRTPRKNLA